MNREKMKGAQMKIESGKKKPIWIKRAMAVSALLMLSSLSVYAYEISVYIQATCTKTTTTNSPSKNADGSWNAVDKNGKSTTVQLGNADGNDPKSYEQHGVSIPTSTSTSSYDCSYTTTVSMS